MSEVGNKAIVGGAEFKKCIELAKKFSSKKSSYPALEYILLKVDHDRATIVASNGHSLVCLAMIAEGNLPETLVEFGDLPKMKKDVGIQLQRVGNTLLVGESSHNIVDLKYPDWRRLLFEEYSRS